MPTTSAQHLGTWGQRCATGSSRRVRRSPPALPSRTMLRLASARASRLAGPAAPSSHMPLTSDPGLSDVPRARVVDRHHHHHLLRGRRQRSDRLWLDLHRHRALLRAGDRCWRLWSSLGGAVAADPAQQRGGHGRAAQTTNTVGKSSARLPFSAMHMPCTCLAHGLRFSFTKMKVYAVAAACRRVAYAYDVARTLPYTWVYMTCIMRGTKTSPLHPLF